MKELFGKANEAISKLNFRWMSRPIKPLRPLHLIKWTVTINYLVVSLAMTPLYGLDCHYRLLEQIKTDFMDAIGTTFFMPVVIMWAWEGVRNE